MLQNPTTKIPSGWVGVRAEAVCGPHALDMAVLRTLIVVKLHSINGNPCTASVTRLANLQNMSVSSIQRHIKTLCRLGLIKVTPQVTKNGNRNTNLVVITRKAASLLKCGGVAPVKPGGRTDETRVVAPVLPKTEYLETEKRREEYAPTSSNDSAAPTPKVKRSKKVKKEPTDNSRIYDRFLELRREAVNLSTWLPSASQAIQMRGNIKKLLENGIPVDVLEECLEAYFQDEWASRKSYPWGFFAKDPLSFRPAEAVLNDSRWEDDL